MKNSSRELNKVNVTPQKTTNDQAKPESNFNQIPEESFAMPELQRPVNIVKSTRRPKALRSSANRVKKVDIDRNQEN